MRRRKQNWGFQGPGSKQMPERHCFSEQYAAEIEKETGFSLFLIVYLLLKGKWTDRISCAFPFAFKPICYRNSLTIGPHSRQGSTAVL